jgi:hypothetical protein
VVTHLNERDETLFWQTLQTFRVLLQKIGFKVWVRGQFTPENVLNELFKKFSTTSEQKAHQAIMTVITTLLSSLENSLSRQDFSQIFTKILTWMLENIQQSLRVSKDTKDKAASTASKLLMKS